MLANDATSGKKKTKRMLGNNPGYWGLFFSLLYIRKLKKKTLVSTLHS
jgi:hypothetical protein